MGRRTALLRGCVVASSWGWASTLSLAQTPEPQLSVESCTCVSCHEQEAKRFAGSVHAGAGIACTACHGGETDYNVAADQVGRWRMVAAALQADEHRVPTSRPASTRPAIASSARFNHGRRFRGKPTHIEVPERCGTCHSDVTVMNPYGLQTDQLSQYRTSRHGQAVLERHSDKAAVCIDCHGTHDIRKPSDPGSSVYAKNVPGTCAHCHANPEVMAGTRLSTTIYDEYRQSVHGQALLEKGDTGMPHCATCHGSHAAVPPGLKDVGHVCGRCHQQEQARFMESIHAKFPLFPRCVGCHTRSVERRDHLIRRVATTTDLMKKTALAVLQESGAGASVADTGSSDGAEELVAAIRRTPELIVPLYESRRSPAVSSFDNFCKRCHNPGNQIAHRAFFGDLDAKVAEMARGFYQALMTCELRYGITAQAVQRAGRGVLLVQDEAMMLEELRTKVVGLAALQHTLDPVKINAAVAEQEQLAGQIQQSLDGKLRGLRWRFWGLAPMWGFVVVFSIALWMKYKQLKRAWVAHQPARQSRNEAAEVAASSMGR